MQLIANTGSVTSTAGFEWINRPINPDNIVRYFCNAEINIDGCDRTKYPAICFNLVTKTAPTQYWVYPDTASRDADCDMLSDAVGPPPSDYLAYWDVTGDGLPDTGSGSGPVAIYIGGVSGTHEADQLYFDEVGIPTAMPVPFDGIIEMRTSGSPYVLANYDGANGSSLGDVTKWTGPYAFDVAANMLGTVGHTNLMQFSKLPFAESNNLTYSRALTYLLKIKARKNGLLSGNIGNILEIPINTSVGLLDFPRDIDVRDYGGKNGLIVHVSLYRTENTTPSGVVDIQDTANRWSQNNLKTDTGEVLGGTSARYFADTFSPTGWSVIWVQSVVGGPLDQRKISYRSTILKFVDGFPRYGLAQDINAYGLLGQQTLDWAGVCVVEALFSNGMPVIVVMKGNSFKKSSITSNTGTTAVPFYDVNPLDVTLISSTLSGISTSQADSLGRIYMPRGRFSTMGQLGRITYTGTNNNAAALVTLGNWGFEEIGDAVAITPAANGDGLSFQGFPYDVGIDEEHPVNGEPTLYVTDPTNSVIFEVTRNLLATGTGADWDWIVAAGQTGVQGSADGIGVLATFRTPRGIKYHDGDLYITDAGSHLVRKMDVITKNVTTYFGVDLMPGLNMQFDF